MAYKASPEVQFKVQVFEQADVKFKEYLDTFETKYAAELKTLESLREIRNTALDEAKRAVREEADEGTDSTVKTITVGRFMATKKESIFYLPEKFMAMLHARNLYDAAIAAKAVQITTSIPYQEAKAFLAKNGLEEEFEECEDGTPANDSRDLPQTSPRLWLRVQGQVTKER
jgi:hypothetical protein